MKNQYVGDIGDFGKYSMFRAFIDAGVKVGVNWYLTEDDGSNDGKFTDYLNKDDMRRYCPEVFDALKGIVGNKDKTVFDIEKSGILPETIFYSEILKPEGTPNDREQEHSSWFLIMVCLKAIMPQSLVERSMFFQVRLKAILLKDIMLFIIAIKAEDLMNNGRHIRASCLAGLRMQNRRF